MLSATLARNAMPGVKLVSQGELLGKSDCVSLHLPLTPSTRHVIGAVQLAQMKPSAYLLNTARGGLFDSAALTAALAAGKLAGAALDVQDPEMAVRLTGGVPENVVPGVLQEVRSAEWAAWRCDR